LRRGEKEEEERCEDWEGARAKEKEEDGIDPVR